MVGADAELPFSVRTLPDLAELVHRKLHLGAGGIAQIVQTKTRMPRRRTQESFVYGTASVHAELLMPPRVVLSAVLSEQAPVKLISFVAGSRRSVVCALNHAGRRGRRNAMNMLCSTSVAIQVSGSTRPHIGDVIPPSAAPAAAPVCFMLRCRNGSSWWQGHFRAAQSRHQFVSGQESKQSLVDHAIVDAIPHNCAVRSSPTAVGCFAMQVHESSCTAGLLTKSRALVPVWGWIRPPVASAHAPPPAASSLRPAAAPVCRFLHCRYRGCFRGVESWHLVVDKQGGMQSLVDLIADSVPYYYSAVKSSPAATGSKIVWHASRVAALLTNSRAIAQASGCIRPFLACAQASPSSAASSLPLAAAPVRFSLRCRDGSRWWHPPRLVNVGVAGGCIIVGHVFLQLPVSVSSRNQQRYAWLALREVAAKRRPRSGILQLTHSYRRGSENCNLHFLPLPLLSTGGCWWQGHFRAARSRHLSVTGQESKQSLVDHAIEDAMPHTCAVRSSPTAVGCFAMQVHESSCTAGLLTKSRALVPVWGWIRPPVASAHAPPPAASSLRPAAAPVCRFLHCRYRGCFRGVESGHLVVDKQGGMQPFLRLPHTQAASLQFISLDLGVVSHFGCTVLPYGRLARFSFVAAGFTAKLLPDASCVAALLTNSRAIIQASGWIRPPVASAHATLPAASSLPPAAVPVSFFLQCKYRGCFRGAEPWHLVVYKQGGMQSLVNLIADSVPYYFRAVKSSPAATGSKLVWHASLVAALLTNSRAIAQASGWIRPPVASAHATLPAASSLPPAAVPVSFFLQCKYRGCFRGVEQWHLVVYKQGGMQSLVDLIADSVPYYFRAVKSSPAATGSKLVWHASLVAALLTNSRAIAQASGWIRPPVASAHATLPAASSLPPAAVPVSFFLQCKYRGCVRGVEQWHLVVYKQGGMQSLVDLIADSVPYYYSLLQCCEV